MAISSVSERDGRMSSTPAFSPQEWQARVELAAAFRLSAIYGWDELLYAHISARVPNEPKHILMHPAHLLFEEITASKLHKLDESCNHVVPCNETPHKFAFPFHKGIYDEFPEANCVVHLHTKAGTAVAMQAQGLIPGNQYALWLGPIGYHEYEGLLSSPEEGVRLASNFRKANSQIVLQKGHGFVLWGRSVPEAFMLAFLLNRACEVQLASLAGSIDPYLPSRSVIEICPQQAKIITDPEAPFNKMTWSAWLRMLEKRAPDYKT